MSVQPLPDDYIVITMLKVILKAESIDRNYDGAWIDFSKRYELNDGN